MEYVREPAVAYAKKKLTLEEYLQWELEGGEKFEYLLPGGDLCYDRSGCQA
jgi:hypothetical protein